MFPTLEHRDDVLKMLDELNEARAEILADCAKLTPAQLADPVIPGTWSVAQNLSHLAWAEAWMLAWIESRPDVLPAGKRPPDVPAELGAIRVALDEAHAAVIAFLKSHPESVLKEPCLYGRGQPERVGGVLFHLLRHEIHHRAFVKWKVARLLGAAA